MTTSPAPAWLVSFESTPLEFRLDKFGSHRSYGNGDNSDISSYTNTLAKAELTALVCYTEAFSKSGIAIYNSQTHLAEKQEKGEQEEHQQLQSIMYFMQTQKFILKCHLHYQNNSELKKITGTRLANEMLKCCLKLCIHYTKFYEIFPKLVGKKLVSSLKKTLDQHEVKNLQISKSFLVK